jgi:uncharacterized membrane protein YsdA (DUF1294 family)
MYPISVTEFHLQYQIECKYPHRREHAPEFAMYLFKRISSFTFGLFGAWFGFLYFRISATSSNFNFFFWPLGASAWQVLAYSNLVLS